MTSNNRQCTFMFLLGILCTIAVGALFSVKAGLSVAAFWLILLGAVGYEKKEDK